MLHHDGHQLLECCLLHGIPSQLALCLCGIAPQVHHVGRAIEVLAHLHQHSSGGLVYSLLVQTLALELQLDACMLEGIVAELPHTVLHACGNHKVLGLLLLQDEPHALYIVLGISPVTQ